MRFEQDSHAVLFLFNKVLQVVVCLFISGRHLFVVFTLSLQAITDSIYYDRITFEFHYGIGPTTLGPVFRIVGKFTEAVYRYLHLHLRLRYRYRLHNPHLALQAVLVCQGFGLHDCFPRLSGGSAT